MMTDADERELHRLCELLRRVDKSLEPGSPLREAVVKAAYGLSLAFIQGLRPRVDELFATNGTELTAEQKDHLRSLGLDPEAPLA